MDSADLLVSGGTLVTMDAKRRVIEDGAIAITGRFIAAIGDASRYRIAVSGAENDRR